MRFALAQLLATFTGPRYVPTLQLGALWTHNAFRVFEQVFGRRRGIRAEARTSAYKNKDGCLIVHREFYTKEAFLAHLEGELRRWLAGDFEFGFRFVRTPVIALNTGGRQLVPWIHYAIAFDAATDADNAGTGSSLTFAHTCTGSNLTLVVYSHKDGAAGTSVSGVTYNSASLTLVDSQNVLGAADDRDIVYCHYKAAPSTGANNVVISGSASCNYAGGAISMTGTAASPAGASGKARGSSADMDVSITTGTNNSWVTQGCGINDTLAATSPAAVSPQTSRYTEEWNNPGKSIVGGTTATTTAGAMTVGWDKTGTAQWGSVAFEVKELAASGPANLKTYNGLAKASVKTINNLAIASIKTFNGLT